jgi:hypothetical protein
MKPFHRVMFVACSLLLVLGIAGTTLIHSQPIPLLVIFLVVPLSLLPGVIRHDRGEILQRDSVLVLPWILLLVFLIPAFALLSGRISLPLLDAWFYRLDQTLGINVAALRSYTVQHPWLDTVSAYSYAALQPMLGLACILPILFSRKQVAENFVLANCLAFIMAMPFFMLFPAVGAWVGYGFQPDAAQKICADSIAMLRAGMNASATGIICFPSFHVIWAILSANALRQFRNIAYPSLILAGLIVASTLATGWHYGVDVVAGVMVSLTAIKTAERVNG